MPQIFFEWSTCFVLHDHLIYHTFSHCQVDFRKFFDFFFDLRHSQDFLRRASCLFALSNALLRTLQVFEIFLEEHRAFCKSKNILQFRFQPQLHAFQISSLVVSNGVHLFQSAPMSFPSSCHLIYHRFFICQIKIEKKLKKSWGWG